MKRAFLTVGLVALVGCGGGSRLSSLQQTSTATATNDDDDDDTSTDTTDTEDDDDDVSTPETYTDATFGTDCTSTAQCGPGLVCSGLKVGATICTTPCVGSGNGGNDDCPSGYACLNYESTTLDGLQICLADWQLGSSTPGYPFTTEPRGACTADDNACQTGVCDTSTDTCVAMCMADRDCGSDEVCYAWATDDGYLHVCYASDLDTYFADGETCSSHDDCDSGVCANGVCANHCRSFADCSGDTVCNFYPMSGSTGWTPVCVTGDYDGTAALGASCSSDADCASEWCLDGVCTTPCATADDCDDVLPGTDCVQLNLANSTAIAYSGSFCR